MRASCGMLSDLKCKLTVANSACFHAWFIRQMGRTLRVGGWVKTGREAGAGAFAFLEVNDGSCFDSLQVR
jgi:aspartyl/asparaginyl-tRNA synthetase